MSIHYAFKCESNANIVKAKIPNASAHFKNTVEAANAIRGMMVNRANQYLRRVIEHKECVPFRKFHGSTGRCAQAKQFGTTKGRWPKKSCNVLLDLLRNAISNAEFKGLDADTLYIRSIQVNAAIPRNRRTYRAHGIINPYMARICHVEIILDCKIEDESEKKKSLKKRFCR